MEGNAKLADQMTSAIVSCVVLGPSQRKTPQPLALSDCPSDRILRHSDQFKPLCCPHDSVSTSQTTSSQDKLQRHQQHERQHSIDPSPSTVLFRGLQRYPLLAPRTIRQRSRLFHLDHTSRPAALLRSRLDGIDSSSQLPDNCWRVVATRLVSHTLRGS